MGNLSDDLDRFLKTDGLRIVYDSYGVRIETYEPLTEEDIEDFDSMDLSNLNEDELEELYDKADELRDDLEDKKHRRSCRCDAVFWNTFGEKKLRVEIAG